MRNAVSSPPSSIGEVQVMLCVGGLLIDGIKKIGYTVHEIQHVAFILNTLAPLLKIETTLPSPPSKIAADKVCAPQFFDTPLTTIHNPAASRYLGQISWSVTCAFINGRAPCDMGFMTCSKKYSVNDLVSCVINTSSVTHFVQPKAAGSLNRTSPSGGTAAPQVPTPHFSRQPMLPGSIHNHHNVSRHGPHAPIY